MELTAARPCLFQRLVHAGFWSSGTGIVPVAAPENLAVDSAPQASPEISVRLSGTEEKEAYLDLFQSAFGSWPEQEPQYRVFQWAEDSLPGSARYVAEIGGQPVGMASLTRRSACLDPKPPSQHLTFRV